MESFAYTCSRRHSPSKSTKEPSTAPDTTMISSTSESPSGSSLHSLSSLSLSLSPLPSLSILIRFLVAPRPLPHPSSVSWRPAFFLITLFRFGTSTSHPPSSPTAKLLLSQCVPFPLLCVALGAYLRSHFLKISCPLFSICISRLVS